MQANASGHVGTPHMTKVTFRTCQICGFTAKSGHGLSLHLHIHQMSLLEYAEQYEGYERPRCTVCGAPARYKGDHYAGRHRKKGFLFYATCSDACRAAAIGQKHAGSKHPNAVAPLKASWARKSPEEQRAITERRIDGIAASMRGGGSSIERQVRDELTVLGIAFEHQKRVGPYIVDFYLPTTDSYIEVDGCYWHGCPQCGHDQKPGLQPKLRRQRRRDGYFKGHGYRVLHLPEHAIRDDFEHVREMLQQWAIPREEASASPVETEREAPSSEG